MKNVLVLTDFSANAAHAEAAALRLSAKLKANMILYHTLPYIPLILSNSEGPLVTESTNILFENTQEHINKEAEELRLLGNEIPGFQVSIDCQYSDGSLADNVCELTGRDDIFMVVMGGRSGSALNHLLNGSDTAAVIRKAYKPVWLIPVAANWNVPKKAVFATDFGTTDIVAVDFLLELAGTLAFTLEVVHVLRPGEVVTEIGPEVAFRNFLAHRGLTCTQVFGQAVQDGLQQYCEENKVDVLALSHHHHAVVSRLFGHSESRSVIAKQQLAVLIFPPNY